MVPSMRFRARVLNVRRARRRLPWVALLVEGECHAAGQPFGGRRGCRAGNKQGGCGGPAARCSMHRHGCRARKRGGGRAGRAARRCAGRQPAPSAISAAQRSLPRARRQRTPAAARTAARRAGRRARRAHSQGRRRSRAAHARCRSSRTQCHPVARAPAGGAPGSAPRARRRSAAAGCGRRRRSGPRDGRRGRTRAGA